MTLTVNRPADGARAALPLPAANRVRKPSWRDPRLAIGLVLVLGSVLAGGRLVAAAQQTEPFFVANHALTPGDPIEADDVRVEQMSVVGGDLYLRADRAFPEDLVARASVETGQLIGVSDLGTDETVAARAFPIAVSGRLASSVRKGVRVDVWSTNEEAQARRIVAGATVAEVQDDSGAFAGANGPTVQVLLDSDQIPLVLQAQADKATLSVLPAAGG